MTGESDHREPMRKRVRAVVRQARERRERLVDLLIPQRLWGSVPGYEDAFRQSLVGAPRSDGEGDR